MMDNSCFRKHSWVIGVILLIVLTLAGVVFAMVGNYDERLRNVENATAASVERGKAIQDSLTRIEADVKELRRQGRPNQ